MNKDNAVEGATATHRFYGPVTLVNVRNAYQGMVKVQTASGEIKPALLGDLDAA